jgi:L-alanine-DL-glutamate epimerase-like enolase superfamily enzyme
MTSRRRFLYSLGLMTVPPNLSAASSGSNALPDPMAALELAASKPILDVSLFSEPVVIESIDILRTANSKFLVRVRSRDGAEGLAVSNDLQMGFLYPLLKERIVPYLVGKDARDWEQLLEGVYRYRSNYKMQGLAFWLPLASVEFAVLDLLGQVSQRAVPDLLGGFVRKKIGLYYAHDDRDLPAKESAQKLAATVRETGAKALKFKVGGRMSRNADSLPGRSEALIPLAREAVGPEVTLYADSNGSYDVAESVRIGRILEKSGVAFFEEPVPFDRFADTKAVADALDIPVAGGEQDASAYNLAWSLAAGALDVVQPDLFYFGGMIRSIRIARMAAALGRECTPHISGTGTGYLYVLHFAACVPNAGEYQEFKGVSDIPLHCGTSSLHPHQGMVDVPTGPGWGISLDPAWLASAEILS